MTEKLPVKRLDVFLVEQGLQPSRERAKEAVASGLVSVNGVVSLKPSRPVTVEDEVICRKGAPRYVGRGGEKLEKALREARLDVRGLTALDVGASTGGFTDCLLQHGAAEVFSVDAVSYTHLPCMAAVIAQMRASSLASSHSVSPNTAEKLGPEGGVLPVRGSKPDTP